MPKIIADLRDNILLQARTLLLKGGFEALTMRAVASGCKVAVGTVYNYFPSKEMLAASVMLQDWQSALQTMRSSSENAAAALEGLRCVASGLTSFWDIYRETWQGYTESGHTVPLYGAYRQHLIHQLEDIIRPLLLRFNCHNEPALPGFLAETLLSAAREGEGRFDELAPILTRLL